MLFRYVDYRAVNVWAVILSAAATAALSPASTFATLVALFVVLGITRGLLRVSSAVTVAELRSEGHDVGPASGVYSAGLDLGAIAGPALGGIVSNAFGVATMFAVMGVLTVVMYFAVAPPARPAARLSVPGLGPPGNARALLATLRRAPPASHHRSTTDSEPR